MREGVRVQLSRTQRRTLTLLAMVSSTSSIPFKTGEVLRRLGYVVRETTTVIRLVHADKDGERNAKEIHPDRPCEWHVWAITPAGRQALSGGGVRRG